MSASMINSLPLGYHLPNGKIVSFDFRTAKRVLRSPRGRASFVYSPSAPNKGGMLEGWLLSLFRGIPVSPGYDYRRMLRGASRYELAKLRRLTKSLNAPMRGGKRSIFDEGRRRIAAAARKAYSMRHRR